jgi:hypothetical protein
MVRVGLAMSSEACVSSTGPRIVTSSTGRPGGPAGRRVTEHGRTVSRAHRPPPGLALAPFTRGTGVAAVGNSALRSAAYRPLMRGAHWVAGQEVTHARLIQACRVVLPPHAVLGGWSAARAHGVCWAAPDSAVEVVLPALDRVRARADLVVRSDRLLPGEIAKTWLGLATSPARTAFDLARRPDPRPGTESRSVDADGAAAWSGSGTRVPAGQGSGRWFGEAVAAVDALLRQTRTQVDEVLELAARHPGCRGCRRALEVLALADPRAESPRESQLRVLLVQSGSPAPELQVEVRDGPQFVARLDLAWPELKVGIEYDGAHHREQGQHSRDLRRHNDLRALGWVVLQVDAAQLAAPARFLADVARLLAERG